MTALLVVSLASVGLTVLVGWLVPAWAMKRLMPALESGGKRVTNYAGRSIPMGLGIVWLVWTAAVATGYAVVYFVFTLGLRQGSADVSWLGALGAAPFVQVAALAALLVPGAAAFGMVDDLFGDGSAKGFRGHLAALARGRLTTGGLKLLGIGGMSLLVGLLAADHAISGLMRSGWVRPLSTLAAWACATLVIALSANLVNLTDLRPGRALKAYSLLAVLGVALATWSVWTGGIGQAATGSALLLPLQLVWIGSAKLSLLALALGPVFAVWRYDLGERAMLGDAGANAMGAFAGLLLAWQSPLWLLAVLALILLVLNLASERVSFSKVIDRVAFLSWADGLGRLPAGSLVVASGQDEDDGERAGGPAAADDDARKDGGTSSR